MTKRPHCRPPYEWYPPPEGTGAGAAQPKCSWYAQVALLFASCISLLHCAHEGPPQEAEVVVILVPVSLGMMSVAPFVAFVPSSYSDHHMSPMMPSLSGLFCM